VSRSRRKRGDGVPQEVAAIRSRLNEFLNHIDESGRQPNNASCGVYVFYDYDGEPIYVGQTTERLRTRIRRHLTNQRTDAVAMNVLDPFEVAEVEVYPFYELESQQSGETVADYKQRVKDTLAAGEYTVFQKVLQESALGAVLNEADIPPRAQIALPTSIRARIIPDDIYKLRKHPDIRLARRATTVANLARVISERDVSIGLRRTLLTQARRLERLAGQRLHDFDGSFPVEEPGEETGETEKQ